MTKTVVTIEYESDTGIACLIRRESQERVDSNGLGCLIGACLTAVEWDLGAKKYLIEGIFESLLEEVGFDREAFVEDLFKRSPPTSTTDQPSC